MAPKKYRIRTGLRSASRSQEAELLSKAKRLKADPEQLIPKCKKSCKQCPFDRVRRNLAMIAASADNKRRLLAFATRGGELEKAYAATLLVAEEGKAPRLAPFKTPHGTTTWIKRGKAKKEMLVGVQHYDDPYWGLFGMLEMVKKNRIHIYSTKSGMVCTGHDPDPPKEFVKESLHRIKYSLKRTDDLMHCPHLDPDEILARKGGAEAYLKLDWNSVDLTFAVCQRCARKVNTNLYATLIMRVAARDPGDDFGLKVIQSPKCESRCKGCVFKDPPAVPDDVMESYEAGSITDDELIDAYTKELAGEIEESGEIIYVHQDRCFGKKRRAFVKSLEPSSKDEEMALLAVLEADGRPHILGRSSAGKLLAELWEEHSMTALMAVTGDRAISREVLRSEKAHDMTPTQLVREAAVASRRDQIISMLPRYEGLPEVAAFADEIARLYRSHGEDDVIRHVDHYRGGDTHTKAAGYAVLLALGKGEGKVWQYTQTERDFADFLKPYIRTLLDAEPGEYNGALQNVLSGTGSVKTIEPIMDGAGPKKKKKKKSTKGGTAGAGTSTGRPSTAGARPKKGSGMGKAKGRGKGTAKGKAKGMAKEGMAKGKRRKTKKGGGLFGLGK